jgi:hypothetical protein
MAALLSGAYQPRGGERVGVIVSGGNTVAVDFERQRASSNPHDGVSSARNR